MDATCKRVSRAPTTKNNKKQITLWCAIADHKSEVPLSLSMEGGAIPVTIDQLCKILKVETLPTDYATQLVGKTFQAYLKVTEDGSVKLTLSHPETEQDVAEVDRLLFGEK